MIAARRRRVELPDREPDVDTSYPTTPNQALLYRLCGDRNPLHADPAFAGSAGFPAPILHGLCSYGIVLREVVDTVLGGDASRAGAFSARFAGVVFPGETIRVRAWDEGARVLVSATIASDNPERDGAPGAERLRAAARLRAGTPTPASTRCRSTPALAPIRRDGM